MDSTQRMDESRLRTVSYEQTKRSVKAVDDALDEIQRLKKGLQEIAAEAATLNQTIVEEMGAMMPKITDLHKRMTEKKLEFDFQKSKVRYAVYLLLAEMEIW